MPTPVITHNQLGWAYQTSFLNNVKPKATFLTQLLFGGRETILPTESVELSYREGERFLAPFVEVNAEAIPVGARSTTFANVSTPNIRIKRSMEAFNAFLRRQPGTNVFIDNSAPVMAARTQAIAEDLLFMSDLIDNRLEWMVGQLITGTTDGKMVLAYEVQQNANWRIEIPRATDVDITLTSTARWNDSAPDLLTDFLTVKRLLSKHVSAPPSVCVMDSLAATAFLKLIKADSGWRELFQSSSNISTGELNLQAQFGENGAIYTAASWACRSGNTTPSTWTMPARRATSWAARRPNKGWPSSWRRAPSTTAPSTTVRSRTTTLSRAAWPSPSGSASPGRPRTRRATPS